MAPSGLGSAIGGVFGGGRATQVEQFAQIALAEEQLSSLLQALEVLGIGDELSKIFEQTYGIQSVVEEVMAYEVPASLVQEYDIISPLEHARLTKERETYMKDLDAEIAELEKEIALDPDQFETLAMGIEAVSEPRSDIQATQAQTIADQSRLEQDRRKMAIEILRNKRDDMRQQIEGAHNNSQAAALRCIDSPIDVKC